LLGIELQLILSSYTLTTAYPGVLGVGGVGGDGDGAGLGEIHDDCK
jgi:hypothetical protein